MDVSWLRSQIWNWMVLHCSRRQYVWSGWLISCFHCGHGSWFLCNDFIWLFGSKFFQECYVSLAICLGKKAPAKSTVINCYIEFQFAWQALEDGNCYGCLVTAIIVEQVVNVKSLIKKHPSLTCGEIQDALGILSGNLNNFLHEIMSVSWNIALNRFLTTLLSSRREVGLKMVHTNAEEIQWRTV